MNFVGCFVRHNFGIVYDYYKNAGVLWASVEHKTVVYGSFPVAAYQIELQVLYSDYIRWERMTYCYETPKKDTQRCFVLK